VKKLAVGKQRGGKGKRRPLRRGALVKKAREVLLEWASLSPETHPINLTRLANKLKVSRQALYDNDLDKEIDRYKKLQHKNFPEIQSTLERKSKDQQIAELKEQVMSMQLKLDGWIERWVAVEYNVRMLGIDPDQIFAVLPGPQRAGTRRHKRRK
jgi:hypothetical protein